MPRLAQPADEVGEIFMEHAMIEASTSGLGTVAAVILLFFVLLVLVGYFRGATREKVVSAAEDELQKIFDLSIDMICIADIAGKFRRINPAFGKTLGYSDEELLGRPYLDFVHPDDRESMLDVIEDKLAKGEKVINFENRYRHKDGSYRWLRWSSRPVVSQGITFAIARDVTELKEVERELLRHHDSLSRLVAERTAELDATTAALQVSEREARARAEQQAAIARLSHLALTGVDVQTLMEETVAAIAETLAVEYAKVLELLPDGDALLLRAGVGWKAGLVGQATVGADADSQAGYTLLSDAPVIVEDLRTETRFSGPPLLLDHGVVSGMSIIIRGKEGPFGVLGTHAAESHRFTEEDIHFLESAANLLAETITMRAAEVELRSLNVDLEGRVKERTAEVERAVGDLRSFGYAVSHDLREPLRIVGSFAQILTEEISDKIDEQSRQYLDRINGGVKRLSAVIEGLLKLSRLGHGQLGHELDNLSDTARSIAGELQARDPARSIEFEIQGGLVATGDSELLRLLLHNLLSNAWKFTGPEENPCVEFGVRTELEGGAVFYVRDNGVGFDNSYADKLFHVFQRLHDGAEFDGLGIGLATVERIVLLHGGRVWAEGLEDEGATFYFTLGDGGAAHRDASASQADQI